MRCFFPVLLLGWMPAAAADAEAWQNDGRTQILEYRTNQSWSINTAPGETVLVMLEPNERIHTVRMSDPAGYKATVTRSRDSLMLRQLSAAPRSTATIETSNRTYALLLSSSPDLPAPYVVAFKTSGATPAAVAPSPFQPPAPPAPAAALRSAGYKLGGDKRLWPETVSDDGAKTYIQWSPDKPVPAVFASERSGQEETINAYMRKGVFTIDRIYDHLIFRIDKVEASAVRESRQKSHG